MRRACRIKIRAAAIRVDHLRNCYSDACCPDVTSIEADTRRLERTAVDVGFESGQNIEITDMHNFSVCGDCAFLIFSFSFTAGLPALHGSEPGQVRKEAATAIFCKCRGSGSPPFFVQLGGSDEYHLPQLHASMIHTVSYGLSLKI